MRNEIAKILWCGVGLASCANCHNKYADKRTGACKECEPQRSFWSIGEETCLELADLIVARLGLEDKSPSSTD